MRKKVLAHIAIVLSGMLFVLFCIDRVNEAMQFFDSGITKWLLAILCVVSVYNAVQLLKPKTKTKRHAR